MADHAAVEGILCGQILGHYQIVDKIGAGGMGDVYRAHDLHLARDVAIKVLPPGTLSDESSRKRFRKEALTLSRLNHPNIATIHDFDTHQGVDFLVMEYIPGITLSEKLTAGPLPERDVVTLGTQLAEGLSVANEHGIVHRDLKPGNLRVTDDGRLKILDFGLAMLWFSAENARTESFSESHAIVGTLPYMAPEQLLGGKIDARTDIHAAGAVLYEMATGQQPFAGVKRSQLVGTILSRMPQPVSALNSELSQDLERIISKCLESDPEKRYQSARELATDLRRTTESGGAMLEPNVRRANQATMWRIAGASLLLVVLLVAGGFLFRSRRAYALSEADTILLSDFVNKTSDPVFDDTLKQALAVELGQSPFLNILSDRKVSATLRMMGHNENERVTPDLGRELCLRSGSKALMAGSITSLGSHYLLNLNAVACSTGDTLAKEESEAVSKEDVLKTLSRASSRLRTKLGESLPSVQKYDVPFEATTSSLDALNLYTMASKVVREQGDAPAIPFLKRAIELDPEFPLAYAQLATAYRNLAQPSLSLEYATKAYRLRDRVTEREKFSLSTVYFDATGELDKEIQVYQLWKASYPRDSTPHANLGADYSYLGQYEKALAEVQEALRLSPDVVLRYASVANSYVFMNRFDEAQAVLNQAIAHKLDSVDIRQNLYAVAFFKEDAPQMEQQLAWAAGRPGEEDVLLSMQSDTEAYFGRLNKARDFTRRAVDSAVRADSKEAAAFWQVNAALREAELGNAALARQAVAAALALSAGRDVKIAAAIVLARTGDLRQAETLARELDQSYPANALLRLYWLSTIKAAIALQKRNSAQAIADLQPAAPYELGALPMFLSNVYPAYVRGQAYLLAHNGAGAAVEFQKLLDHRGVVLNFVTGSLAHLQLGRAYAMSGDRVKARAAYRNFFALWKDADPDLPILKQARLEYAKLQG